MKKLICALLAVAMMLSLLTGCTSKTETTQAETTQETATTAATTQAATEAATEAKAEEPAEWSEETWLPLVKDGEKKTLTIGIQQIAKVEDWDNNKLTQYIEEQTGIDVEFVFFSTDLSEAQQQMSLMAVSGEKLPDILWGFIGWTTPTFVNSFGEDGFLVPLNDYLEENAPYFQKALERTDEALVARIYNKITDPTDGNIYGLPYVSDMYTWDNRQSIMSINQQWLDKLGMTAPTTPDELYEVLKAFVGNDPNGNGKADEIGMIGNGKDAADIISWIINAYVYFDNQNPINISNGNLWVPYTTEEYREALKFITKLTEEGLISPSCFTNIDSAELKGINSPADGVSVTGIACCHPSVGFDDTVGNYIEYSPLAALKDATGLGGYDVVRPMDIRIPSAITKDCDDVELAVRFLDFFYRDETATSVRHGMRGVNWEYADIDADRSTSNINVLDDGQAFFDGVTTYNRNTNSIFDAYNYLAAASSADTEIGKKKLEAQYAMEDMMRADQKTEDVIYDLIYTADEAETVNPIKTNLMSAVRQARGEFCTGARDISNDADWQAYLDELEGIGLTEYLEINQTAYERTK